ncbi:MAG: acyl-CoA desaturase, partial [Actinomycetota bacterium]|nr:acyl-CoA desaturase [Actinomycetota bacterium]
MAQDAAVPAPTTIPGVMPRTSGAARAQRISILIATVVPFAGFVAAIALLWGHGVSAVDLAIFGAFYVVSGLGITVGYHRLLTHRSFEAPHAVKVALAVFGSLAVEGSVIEWVSDHRRHHAYADKVGDPHSPHVESEEGFVGIAKGLWHAHMGWLFTKEKTQPERWSPDLLKDAAMRRVDRAFPALVVFTFAAPAVLGYAITGTFAGALTAFVWGALARVFLLHHVTWSVNSICHFYGSRPYETTDYSTNNWPLALISFGESWHNNHHAFPSSAIHGIEPS